MSNLSGDDPGRTEQSTARQLELPTEDLPATPLAARPAPASLGLLHSARQDNLPELPLAADLQGHLLLVDDRLELLESLRVLVELTGHSCDLASSGEVALELLSCNQYDVVLLDLMMPGLTGHDVIDWVMAEGIDTRIIVVSGDSSFRGVKTALTHGAFDFVRKPYEADELMATVQNALRRNVLESRHRLMEERLQQSEELHRFIVNSSPDLVYMLDREGHFTFLNDRAESLLGYTKEQLLGRHYSVLVDDGDRDSAEYVFNERRTGERSSRNVELRLLTRHGNAKQFSASTMCIELSAMGVYADESLDGGHFIGTYGTARDITERKEAEEVINFQAYHDLLTHLPNRALLKDRLSLAITHAKRNATRLAVMFLDLDRFKIVNDTLGHSMGDRLLKAVATRLQGCLRRGDTLSRFGGDEFTLLLPEVRSRDDVESIASKILTRLAEPFHIDGHELFVGCSIGISMYPEAGDNVETLIRNADIAMYHIKGRGKNGFQFFSEEMNQQFSSRLNMERELRNALVGDQFRVHYQPQVSLDSGRIVGVEALIRWDHPTRGLILPSEFLPVAEETGLIIQLDEVVHRQAMRDLQRWQQHGFAEVRVSLNISALHLQQEQFVERFLEVLATVGVEEGVVKLEITENMIMQDVDDVVPKLQALAENGVRIAIDDFGTGYSSLSYLQQFPVNTLKIDRSFVSDISSDNDIGSSHASIVNAIVAMARGLDLGLIAEGVEHSSQLRYLQRQGCQEVQGFIFSRAVPIEQLLVLLQRNRFKDLVLGGDAKSSQAQAAG